MIETLWSDWLELQVLLDVGAHDGSDPTFTLDDPAHGQLDVGVLGSPIEPYSDVTCDARALQWQYGATRSDGVLTRWEAGSAAVVLDNNRGQYPVAADETPIVPMCGLVVNARLTALANGGTVGAWAPMFTGYVNSFALAYDGLDATVTVAATDGTALLADYESPALGAPVGAGETASARVARILDQAEWPAAARNLEAGGQAMAATDLSGDAWSQLVEVGDAELGAVYLAPDGKVQFVTRATLFGQLTGSGAPAATFGPDASGGDLRYEDAVLAVDDALLRNIVDAERPGGVVQSVRDQTSVEKYQPHRYASPQLVLNTDPDVRAWASLVLQSSSAPFSRVEALELWPMLDPLELFPLVVQTAYLDAWHVTVDPPGALPQSIERDALVRGWQHVVDRESWTATYTLSSRNAFTPFILDDAATQLDVARLTA
jgi:hypothetical protein